MSCRKLVQDEFSYYPQLPVVNCILKTDSAILVHVSLTDKIGKNEVPVVNNAEVSLYIDEEFIETLSFTHNGLYRSSNQVFPDHKYSINVRIPGLEPAEASTFITSPPVITEINHSAYAGRDEEGYIYSSITFTFIDDPEQDDYYRALIAYGGTADEFLYITDPVLLNEGLPLTIFSDELIEDGQYTMTLNYRNNESRTITDQPDHTFSPIVFELQSISYDYYEYLKHLYLYETGRYPSILGGVVTTSQLYSNVNNGFGIVGGYSSTLTDTIFPGPLTNKIGNESK